MKLEAIDPLNLGNICVATICKVSLWLPSHPPVAVREGAGAEPGTPCPPRSRLAAPGAPGFCELPTENTEAQTDLGPGARIAVR